MASVYTSFFKYKLHHVLFWLVYFTGWVFVYRNIYTDLVTLLIITFIYMVAHASVYYTTQYLLIPRLLGGRVFMAILTFIEIVLIASVIMFFLFRQIISSDNMVGFRSIEYQFIVSIFLSIIFMVGILLGAKSVIDRVRNRRQTEKINTERLQSELHYLKAQVNPHFLFNTINSIYVLINVDPAKASQTLIKLSELLRAQLYEFGEEYISIEHEINYLENYIALEKIRKNDNLKVQLEKEGDLSHFKVAPLLLIPFLENCFKHVSGYKNQENYIRIRFGHTNGIFTAAFCNSTEAAARPVNGLGGIGLKNIKRRLELIYPGRHELRIQNEGNIFSVQLTLQVNDKT